MLLSGRTSSGPAGGRCFLLRLFGPSGSWIASSASRTDAHFENTRREVSFRPPVRLRRRGTPPPGAAIRMRIPGALGSSAASAMEDPRPWPALHPGAQRGLAAPGFGGAGEGGACEDMSPHAWEPSGVGAAGGGLRGRAPGHPLRSQPLSVPSRHKPRLRDFVTFFFFFLSAGMSKLFHFRLLK